MEFLKAVSALEAREIIDKAATGPGKGVPVPLHHALGRVAAEDIRAPHDVPPFDRSLVDGFAVRSRDTQGAKETNPVMLALHGEVRVGEEAGVTVSHGSAVAVSTGAMVPAGADGVVMEEYVRRLPDAIEVIRAVHRRENISFRGDDVKAGSTVIDGGTVLTPFGLGVLAALGVAEVPVFAAPLAGIISSGDEVVPVDSALGPGKIRDVNRYTVSGLLEREGFRTTFLGIAGDDVDRIAEAMRSGKETDLLLVSGGSSKGGKDFVVTALTELGGEVLFHGINIKPGKPAIFGRLWGKPVFGLPGHPFSCIMVMIRFVLPLARRMTGRKVDQGRRVTGRLTTNVPSSFGIEECVRVTLGRGEDGIAVTPELAKSSDISSLVRAQGYVVVPEGVEGLEQGEEVEVILFP